jgi:hypothetical protein
MCSSHVLIPCARLPQDYEEPASQLPVDGITAKDVDAPIERPADGADGSAKAVAAGAE